jgi:hypothetical protein
VILSCAAGAATAQIPPRPPMPIPNVVALMPPTAPLTRSAPTPIPPHLAPVKPVMFPVPGIALPPSRYDRPYEGKLTVVKENDYNLVRHVCSDVPNAIACSYQTFDTATGKPIACLIMLGPAAHDDERVMRHEIGHCGGWPADHPGARYGD